MNLDVEFYLGIEKDKLEAIKLILELLDIAHKGRLHYGEISNKLYEYGYLAFAVDSALVYGVNHHFINMNGEGYVTRRKT